MDDEKLMAECLRLASKGRRAVSPNPMVGAVIVKNGRVIGRGFHQFFGGPHAEIEALHAAQVSVRGATLYVNLEPCSHHGKQPPCAEAIVQHEITRVVVGVTDPNSLVGGRGIAYLKKHGIEVLSGVLEKQCRDLNRAFFKHIATGLPWVTLKIAQSLDGRIAAGRNKRGWITSKPSRRYVHKMRSEYDGVLVGIKTVLADDPELTVRYSDGKNPHRFVLDGGLRIPLDSKLLSPTLARGTTIITSANVTVEQINRVRKTGAQLWEATISPAGGLDLKRALAQIGDSGIGTLLVEGGSRVFTSFLREGLADEVAIFIAPKLIGTGVNAVGDLRVADVSQAIKLMKMTSETIGPDLLVTGRLEEGTN